MIQLNLFRDLSCVRLNGPYFSMLEYEKEIKRLREENSLYKHKYAGKCRRATKKTK